jgi:hypothetical protein
MGCGYWCPGGRRKGSVMQIGGGSGDIHHHGVLAGIGAGTAAVLFAFGVLALAWHRVAGQVSLAVTVFAYAVMAATAVVVCAATFYIVLWVRHRARNPELLVGRRQVVQAEAVTMLPSGATVTPVAGALPYAVPAAIEAPRREIHYHFDTAEAVWAARRVMGTAGTPEAEEIPR